MSHEIEDETEGNSQKKRDTSCSILHPILLTAKHPEVQLLKMSHCDNIHEYKEYVINLL